MLGWQPIFDGTGPPVFKKDREVRSLFYAPGWLVSVPRREADHFEAQLRLAPAGGSGAAAELLQHARDALTAWNEMLSAEFEPLCLTLYPTNACNLECSYCFSRPYRGSPAPLSMDAVRAAGELVAANCRLRGVPLTIVIHGGGEPTQEYPLLQQALAALEDIAARTGLSCFRYLATNGVMPSERAADMARRFDLVGLSCDGPALIQNRQRPLRRANEHTSAWFVERAAQAVQHAGKPLHVRVTVTPATAARQAEIAEYICRTLRPMEIHVEPVYDSGRAGAGCFHADDVEIYLKGFLEGQRLAEAHGVRWLSSGTRPGEIHDAYCNIWRNVLNLTPDGVATACFKCAEGGSTRAHGFDIGAWDEVECRFHMHHERVTALRSALRQSPDACATCFNHFHCARCCPDACRSTAEAPVDGFRCRVQSLLADHIIQEAADRVERGVPSGQAIVTGVTRVII